MRRCYHHPTPQCRSSCMIWIFLKLDDPFFQKINTFKMWNICTQHKMLKQAKNLRRIARLISRSALGPGPAGLNNLQDRLFQVYPEVAEAIVSKRPVVALESTIITHGMPYPENLRYVNANKTPLLWRKKGFIKDGWDQHQYLSDCTPTSALTQQRSPDNKLELKMG